MRIDRSLEGLRMMSLGEELGGHTKLYHLLEERFNIWQKSFFMLC